MPLKKNIPTLPQSIVQLLLDIYAEKTGLPVAIYQKSVGTFTWSRYGSYSPLCLALSPNSLSEPNPLCKADHVRRCESARGEIELCHAGLWNIAFPIMLEGRETAILITGQRRLADSDRETQSLDMFERFSRTNEAKNIRNLRTAFEQTQMIKQSDFDRHLLESLKSIQEYLYSWMLTQNAEDKARRKKIQQLAHEFLLPIQSIIADAENLFLELTPGEHKDIAQDVLESMLKLANIAENMRGSLIEAKQQPYHFSKYNLYKCLLKSSSLYRKEALKKGVEIRKPYTTDGEPFPEIEMAIPGLNRAFTNLIHNAVKYSYSSADQDRFIRIVGEPAGEFYGVTIANYGIGILPEELLNDKIFEDGYRGQLSADRHRTGSGMGLAEVKKIIQKHSGRVTITSVFKGAAYLTEVKVFLPYVQKSEEA